MNKVILIGSMGADPELKYTQSGTAVLSFTLCTNERYQDKHTKEWKDKPEWHKVVVWGKYGESLHRNTGKGTLVCVEGKLATRSWQDKQGTKRYSTEVIADRCELLARYGGERGSQGERRPEPSAHERAKMDGYAPRGRGEPERISQEDLGFADDDIPF